MVDGLHCGAVWTPTLMIDHNEKQIGSALLALDAWFESLRTPHGIGGPVAHWWESSLIYCGPMTDWRYEGLLSGYVELHRKTQTAHWLERALVAGNEVCAAQLAD